VRAEEHQRRRFSKILAAAMGDQRLHTLMTLRADFFGNLQADESLFCGSPSRKYTAAAGGPATRRDIASSSALGR
jgi:hypothetical protein